MIKFKNLAIVPDIIGCIGYACIQFKATLNIAYRIDFGKTL
ncbi:hypothetical protein [Mucilaginibacter sp.]|nr:hypothetical protein [Mucilaginibacter sp.]